ncbi:hypothetical protein E3U43_015265 [Larimichthys crocea]|uniref:Uncharacterized protein n=1 Tax=Larimichthys crocea TaxID=215358 RepID=A0ACD3RNS8_LARCR|nr:hypothetical protein E3U43_015265 [Larimichthys crocea]
MVSHLTLSQCWDIMEVAVLHHSCTHSCTAVLIGKENITVMLAAQEKQFRYTTDPLSSHATQGKISAPQTLPHKASLSDGLKPEKRHHSVPSVVRPYIPKRQRLATSVETADPKYSAEQVPGNQIRASQNSVRSVAESKAVSCTQARCRRDTEKASDESGRPPGSGQHSAMVSRASSQSSAAVCVHGQDFQGVGWSRERAMPEGLHLPLREPCAMPVGPPVGDTFSPARLITLL